jgi:FkbM family methyltransferase
MKFEAPWILEFLNLKAQPRRIVPLKSLRSKMKRQIAEALTPICSTLIYLLHNRSTSSFNRLELQSVQFSYSQFGEDLAVCRLADELGLNKGVYVDVGAYHPIFGSNTLLLHKKGWQGINVDLAAERIAEFQRYRPMDHNVVACLSDKVAPVEIAHYEIPSTDRVVDSQNAEKLSIVGQKPISSSSTITTTLTAVLEKSPFRLDEVRYLNVDCEGSDLAVIRGLDLDRCHPAILSIEAFGEAERKAIERFLDPHGYRCEFRIPPTVIFVRR